MTKIKEAVFKWIPAFAGMTMLWLLISVPVSAHSVPVVIKMTSSGFEPQEVTIDSDTTLIFENVDSIDHWPASDVHPTHDIYPEFDPQKPISPGEVWRFKPTRVGTFKFHDHLFPHKKGILTISGQPTQPTNRLFGINLQSEVKRILDQGVFHLKSQDEDTNTYLKNLMDYCFKNGGRDYCYKDLAYILSYQFDLVKILDLLAKNESYAGVFARCHELTHYLTRLAYKKTPSISTIYDQCTSVCHGGCYHGAIEQYLQDKKISLTDSKIEAEIPKVCGVSKDYKVPLLYDECIHGIGHGTMYINDSDLIASLKLCDKLAEQKDQQTCYSGVFMENSSSSTNLDHQSKFIKSDDPLYPCNILDKKYLDVCYRYQSSHFAIISGSDWSKVAKLCLQVPPQYQHFCFLTVGSNQVGFTRDFQTIISDCNLMPSYQAKNDCFEGAVDALAIRYRDDFQKGVQFCSMLNPKFQQGCFKQYGSSIFSWSSDPNSKVKLCDSIGNLKFSNWCKAEETFSTPFVLMLKKLWAKLSELSKSLAKTNSQNLQILPFDKQMNVLKEISSKDGPAKAWQYLIDSFKDENGASGNIHDLAHLMGGLIFDAKGFAGLKFCTPDFAFGCFHGFLDKAFASSLDNLDKAETACKSLGNGGPYASCIHGIGHGVASFYQTANLNSALTACDKLKNGAQFCYDGVFMEFERNAPASFFKSDDPLYPCDSVDEKYVFACGRNQPQVLLQRFKFSFEKIADFCLLSQNQNFKSACVSALGFYIASKTYGQAEGILANCSEIKDPQFQIQCSISAAGELIFQNMPGWQSQAFKVCDKLGDGKASCQAYLNGLIKDYNRH